MNNQSTVGRPKKEITKEMLFDLYSKHENWYTVADALGISKSTLYRRLHEYGISRFYGCKY